MRILILTQFYYPEPLEKFHTIAMFLVGRGHQVTVITAYPNYPSGKVFRGYRQRLFTRENIDGIDVIRVPIYPDKSNSSIRRAINYISFFISSLLPFCIISRRCDVALVYNPMMSGLVAGLSNIISKTRYVLEIWDIWPETLSTTGMVKNKIVLGLIDRIISFVYSRASALTVISDGFKVALEAKGVAPQKIHSIHNWAYEDGIRKQTETQDDEFNLIPAGVFNVLYAGNMGPAQGLENIINVATLLRDRKDINFILMGEGICREELEKTSKDRGLENVKFVDRVHVDKMPSVYAKADATLVHLKNEPLFEITIPGKTQSLMYHGKPIIGAVKGDAADLILKSGAGLVAKPMDPESLLDAIMKMKAMTLEERAKMGESGKRYYEKNLASNVQLGKYETLLDSVRKQREEIN